MLPCHRYKCGAWVQWLVNFCLAVVVLIGLGACSTKPGPTDLPFQTLQRDELSGTGQLYPSQAPGIVIVGNPTEADTLDGWIADSAKAKLKTVDYTKFLAVTVFQGWKPTGGFGIEVVRISRLGQTVDVATDFHEPVPGVQRTDIVTSPYHLVQLEKPSAAGQAVVFNVTAKATVVVSATYTIP